MSADVAVDADKRELAGDPISRSIEELVAETSTLPAWWSLSVLPSSYEGGLSQALSAAVDDSPVDEQSEYQALITSTREVISTLRSRMSARWIATLHMFEWSASQESTRAKLIETCARESISAPPPLCYRVVLEIESQMLVLSPASLALITRLDHEIGRRIGDELDGQRPEGAS